MLGIVTQGMSEKSVPGYGVLLLSGGRVLSDMYPGAFPEVPAGQIMVPGHNIPGSTYDVLPPEKTLSAPTRWMGEKRERCDD